MDSDLDELQVSPSLRDGVTGLWIVVFVDACEMAIRYRNKRAEAYLFEENYFFDIVAERLDYTPEGLRERIRKAMTRAHEDHPGRLALGGAVKRSHPETGEETGRKEIVDCRGNPGRHIFLAFSGKLSDDFLTVPNFRAFILS